MGKRPIETIEEGKLFKEQTPFFSLYPETIASRCVRAIARNPMGRSPEEARHRGPDAFRAEWVEVFQGPMKLPVAQKSKKDVPQGEEPREAERAVPGPVLEKAAEGEEKPSSFGMAEGPLGAVVPLLRGLLEVVSVLSREVAVIRQSVEDLRRPLRRSGPPGAHSTRRGRWR